MTRIWCSLLSMVLGFGTTLIVASAQNQPITAEWVYGEQGSHVADVPHYAWLDNGNAILYDTRVPKSQRTFEQLNPSTRKRQPILNMSAAVGSLASLVNIPDAKESLPWRG